MTTLYSFFLMIRPPPSPTLFPYTTLFRSQPDHIYSQQQSRMLLERLTESLPEREQLVIKLHYGRYMTMKEIGLKLRSEEHTSELQSRGHLVCRLLLEKKKKHTCKCKLSLL